MGIGTKVTKKTLNYTYRSIFILIFFVWYKKSKYEPVWHISLRQNSFNENRHKVAYMDAGNGWYDTHVT